MGAWAPGRPRPGSLAGGLAPRRPPSLDRVSLQERGNWYAPTWNAGASCASIASNAPPYIDI
jgi:hypothetical protein